jgi:pyruvate-formate lyase-activating enzyme
MNAIANPEIIRIDACSKCQLRCIGCGQTNGAFRCVGEPASLNADLFANLLDENPQVKGVELGNMGEALLNPHLPRILEAAYRRGVKTQIMTGLNMNTASDEALESFVKFRVDRIKVSIDGVSDESYRQYRIGGSYEKAMGNLKKLLRIKQDCGSKYPRIRWQFIVFGHNEHEVERAREMAYEMGVELYFKGNSRSNVSPASKEGEAVANRTKPGAECLWLWECPSLTPTGDVLGCCKNTRQVLGLNVFADGLRAALNSPAMIRTRRWLANMTDETPPQCKPCRVARERKDRNEWVTGEDVSKMRANVFRLFGFERDR